MITIRRNHTDSMRSPLGHPVTGKNWKRALATALVLTSAVAIMPPIASAAADGTLDTTFGTGGKVTTDVAGSDETARSVAIQSDGKIIVVGLSSNSNGDFAVVRYNTNGSLDTTFDTDGKVTTDINGVGLGDEAYAVTVQSDGKIVVAGQGRIGANDNFAVVRYNTNGSLDTTFDTDGKVITDIGSNSVDAGYSVAIQSDGKIVVGGKSSNDFAVVRYTTTGSLDTTFDTDGKVTTDIGTSSSDSGNSVAIQSDGKIVVGGQSSNDFAVVRYTTTGSLDTTFDTDGKATTDIGTSTFDFGYSAAIQSDGKIVVVGMPAGPTSNFAVVRYEVTISVAPTTTTIAAATTTTVAATVTVATTTIAPKTTTTTVPKSVFDSAVPGVTVTDTKVYQTAPKEVAGESAIMVLTPAQNKVADVVSKTPSVCLPSDNDLVFIDEGRCIADVVNTKTRQVLRTLKTTVVADDISEVEVGNEVVILTPLYFGAGSINLKAQSLARLTKLKDRVTSAGSVLVAGHSGVLMGNTPENIRLAKARADATVSILKARGAKGPFAIASVGALDPVTTVKTQAAQEKNRRVVIVLIP